LSGAAVDVGGVLAHPVAAGPRRGRLQAALVTVRPRQWIKNGLVVAAAGAAGALGHDGVPVRVGLAWVAFCMLASGIYAVNDVRDAEEDRLHPRKRYRPVAAGELEPRTATALGLALMLSGLALCAIVRLPLAGVGAAYVALTLSYTLIWRHILVLDVIAIAGGFVLRAVAGGVAAPVGLSRWFVLVVTCVAVFIATGQAVGRAAADGGGGTKTARARALHGCATAAHPCRQRRGRAGLILRMGIPASRCERDPVASADRIAIRRRPAALRRPHTQGGRRGARGAGDR